MSSKSVLESGPSTQSGCSKSDLESGISTQFESSKNDPESGPSTQSKSSKKDLESGPSGSSTQFGSSKNDLETGPSTQPLYPNMIESPELRWAFIRKIYSILAFQLLLTVAVAATVVSCKPISVFFSTTIAGRTLYIILVFVPIITVWALYYHSQRHPINLILLIIYTSSLAFLIGLACAFTEGKIILEAAIITSVVVVSLTLYTFWAVKRGYDFSFLGPLLFSALLVLLAFGFIQILFPMGKLSHMIYGGLAALVFSVYIVFDTYFLIARYSYDEYIWASINLYIDILNIFLALLKLFKARDS